MVRYFYMFACYTITLMKMHYFTTESSANYSKPFLTRLVIREKLYSEKIYILTLSELLGNMNLQHFLIYTFYKKVSERSVQCLLPASLSNTAFVIGKYQAKPTQSHKNIRRRILLDPTEGQSNISCFTQGSVCASAKFTSNNLPLQLLCSNQYQKPMASEHEGT